MRNGLTMEMDVHVGSSVCIFRVKLLKMDEMIEGKDERKYI